MIQNNDGKKVIRTQNDLNQYIDSLKEYSEKVVSGKISPEESLKSLINAGICNKEKMLNEMYRDKKEEIKI